MQDAGLPEDEVRRLLSVARGEDHRFADGHILGSMCTRPHDLAAEAYAMFLETNLGDPGHFPGAARLEGEVLKDLESVLHAAAPGAAKYLTGGTEANLLACYIAREKTGKREVIVPETAHFSFEKATRLLDMHLTKVPNGPDQRADPQAMAAAVTEDTALMVGVAGSTELGLVDDITALSEVAAERKIRLHVDAAFGGYVLPFLEDAPAFDFQLPGVTSIGLDPHKMGMAPIPGGALLVRDPQDWQATAVETGYVSTDTQSTLMGTRPGAAAAAAWAVHRVLGRDGYRSIVANCMQNTLLLAHGLEANGATLAAQPELNVVTFRAGDPHAFAEAAGALGFRLNVVPRLNALRIVVNPHVDRAATERFLEALPTLMENHGH